jgi:hypothetical protein
MYDTRFHEEWMVGLVPCFWSLGREQNIPSIVMMRFKNGALGSRLGSYSNLRLDESVLTRSIEFSYIIPS